MITKKQLKFLRSLKQKKYRQLSQKFIVEGLRGCWDLLNSDFIVEQLFIDSEFGQKERPEEILALATSKNIEIIKGTSQELTAISDTVQPQGIVALVQMRSMTFSDKVPDNLNFVLLLDRINEPGNLGAIIRAASWFGIDAVFASPDSVSLYNPKVIRSSMGALFHLPIYEGVELTTLSSLLKKHQFRIFATDVHSGAALDSVKYGSRIALIMGNEAEGINKELMINSDQVIQIPRYGKSESLNVAVATGIFLYHIHKNKTNDRD